MKEEDASENEGSYWTANKLTGDPANKTWVGCTTTVPENWVDQVEGGRPYVLR